jgi:diadenosine tetraphosphate (Ap4A) HIT family hydrolase
MTDCHRLGRFPHSHLLLHKNALLPWFILVPETALTGLFELEPALRLAVMEESALVSRFIATELGCSKVNFAAIGNMVPQLHLHLVGRRVGDPCWPDPVWGHLQGRREYPPLQIRDWSARLAEKYGLKPHA